MNPTCITKKVMEVKDGSTEKCLMSSDFLSAADATRVVSMCLRNSKVYEAILAEFAFRGSQHRHTWMPLLEILPRPEIATTTFVIGRALRDYINALRLQVVLKELVDKFEISFATVHPKKIGSADACILSVFDDLPGAFVIEKAIRALFVLLGNCFRFLMALEPCLILFVEPPALVLQSTCRQPLLIRILPIVKDVEQSVGFHSLILIQCRIVEDR